MNKDDVLFLYKELEKRDIKVWLDGGWGVDALLGQQSRAHDDIDLIVQKKDVTNLNNYLEAKGYSQIQTDDARSWNYVLGDREGHKVDVHVIVIDRKGKGIYGPVENDEKYPANALTGVGKIDDVKVSCLTADYQLESHSGYELREKDYLDIKLLCKKFGLSLPKEYLTKRKTP